MRVGHLKVNRQGKLVDMAYQEIVEVRMLREFGQKRIVVKVDGHGVAQPAQGQLMRNLRHHRKLSPSRFHDGRFDVDGEHRVQERVGMRVAVAGGDLRLSR